MRVTVEFMKSWEKIFLVLAIVFWLATGCAIISRVQLVFDYSTLTLVPPEYEVIAGSASAIAALLAPMAILALMCVLGRRTGDSKPLLEQPVSSSNAKNFACWFVASFPLLLLLMRILGLGAPAPGWWELAWFAGWTGLATRMSLHNQDFVFAARKWHCYAFLSFAVAGCTCWWFSQSLAYHAEYQLGFNDFGHFSQRISNTANGYGFLLESPVLPPFWDHFNPGLILLVPLWSIYPKVELIFAVQSVCLAGSAWLVAAIAVSRGESAFTACAWGLAWLLYPSIGQINLAYTYGWHPITLAIPVLLAAYLSLTRGMVWIAMACAVLASSFEEGVLVVIACYAAAQSLRIWGKQQQFRKQTSPNEASASSSIAFEQTGALPGWLIVTCVSVASFILVYQFSGFAPFQTGRFARLGTSAVEIIASPILRPDAFWGQLLRPRNFAFAVLMLVPFATVGSISYGSRAWLWSLLAISPPVLVLMIWEHLPAQSLAFQYTSCLIPILFVGIIETTTKTPKPESRAVGMLTTVWILSISIGQMPWSNDSLGDIKAKTYGLQSSVESRKNRIYGSKEAQRITAWIQSLQKRSSETDGPGSATERLPDWKSLRVLATGRIAAHFVGVRDVETVGQFWQRYDALKSLDTNLASPILRYDVILLDLHESFQQTPEETARTLIEAETHGWRKWKSERDFLVLTR
jgi:uncharacterized membrane protein